MQILEHLFNSYAQRNLLKETYLMHAILMRMRGGEIMQGRRRKYRRNEDRIEQFKANYMQDQLS